MENEQAFSHITVTPHEEEEVVIHVGARGCDTSASSALEAEKPAAPEESATSATPAAPAATAACATSAPPAASAAPTTSATPTTHAAPADHSAERRTSTGRQAEKGYNETTLDDLERQPRPLSQKIVLVAVVLLLVGFAVYYLFLR